MQIWKRISFLAVTISGIAFCIKQVREPDLWWQLRTGDYILEEGSVPKVDVFSYTYAGEPWINVKWLTEVLMASWTNVLGVENIMLLQLVVILAIGFILFRFSRATTKKFNSAAFLFSSLAIILAFSYRINARPEMVSHLFTCIFLLIWQHYRKKEGNSIFWIIPLQMLWANMHEAFGLGPILGIIFLTGFLVERRIYKQKILLVKPALALCLSVLAIAVNPIGFKLILHPINVFKQLEENQFSTEMLGFSDQRYWNYAAILFAVILIISLFQLLKDWRSLSDKKRQTLFGPAYILVFLALAFLALRSQRNIPYFLFVALPVLYVWLNSVLHESKKVYIAVSIASLALYCAVASGVFYKQLLPREQFGLSINAKKNPIGSANFLKDNGISGKGFTDYLSSSYLLWALQPEFKSYLDLRDLDVFPSEFIKNIFMVYANPGIRLEGGQTLWDYICSADTFNYVAILNGDDFSNFHRYINQTDSLFFPAYADGLMTVYLRDSEENRTLLKKLEIGTDPKNIFQKYSVVEPNLLAKSLTKILWPFPSSDQFSKKEFERERADWLALTGLAN